ncbi:MAG: leucyl aminopeptidase, partial [Gammaproteobacteria bacterium]|nr:leucyl aminopeptidase [Gammaproteobacteria bacterium]
MIDFKIKSGNPEKQQSSCLVLAVFEDQGMSPSSQIIDKNSKGLISRLIKRGDITGECGEARLLPEIANIPA